MNKMPNPKSRHPTTTSRFVEMPFANDTHHQAVNPFPEDHELLSIFESEPEVLDADVPWFYNTLTFRGDRDGLKSQDC
jgi:hypothetical protein